MSKNNTPSNFPIDLVYMWVDGKDPQWIAKRNQYLPAQATPTQACVTEARWVENDELRYSLRSVEMYAPWINHIYIVTDNQVPRWLNTDNPKITIVDHSEILDKEALPVFNSHAIESRIYKIPGLSEHFILGNDDTLFAQPVTPHHFFTPEGAPIVRLKGSKFNRRKAAKRCNYNRVLLRMQDIAYEKWNKKIYHAPHHNFDAYRISDFEACVELMPEEWHATSYSRFRNDNDLQRCLVSYYVVATRRGVLRKVDRYNNVDGIIATIKSLITGRYAADSRCIPVQNIDFHKVIDKYNPLMLCMNDGEYTTDTARSNMVKLLNEMYPTKCKYEK